MTKRAFILRGSYFCEKYNNLWILCELRRILFIGRIFCELQISVDIVRTPQDTIYRTHILRTVDICRYCANSAGYCLQDAHFANCRYLQILCELRRILFIGRTFCELQISVDIVRTPQDTVYRTHILRTVDICRYCANSAGYCLQDAHFANCRYLQILCELRRILFIGRTFCELQISVDIVRTPQDTVYRTHILRTVDICRYCANSAGYCLQDAHFANCRYLQILCELRRILFIGRTFCELQISVDIVRTPQDTVYRTHILRTVDICRYCANSAGYCLQDAHFANCRYLQILCELRRILFIGRTFCELQISVDIVRTPQDTVYRTHILRTVDICRYCANSAGYCLQDAHFANCRYLQILCELRRILFIGRTFCELQISVDIVRTPQDTVYRTHILRTVDICRYCANSAGYCLQDAHFANCRYLQILCELRRILFIGRTFCELQISVDIVRTPQDTVYRTHILRTVDICRYCANSAGYCLQDAHFANCRYLQILCELRRILFIGRTFCELQISVDIVRTPQDTVYRTHILRTVDICRYCANSAGYCLQDAHFANCRYLQILCELRRILFIGRTFCELQISVDIVRTPQDTVYRTHILRTVDICRYCANSAGYCLQDAHFANCRYLQILCELRIILFIGRTFCELQISVDIVRTPHYTVYRTHILRTVDICRYCANSALYCLQDAHFANCRYLQILCELRIILFIGRTFCELQISVDIVRTPHYTVYRTHILRTVDICRYCANSA